MTARIPGRSVSLMLTNSLEAAMTLTSERSIVAAARAVDLVKSYGAGELAVRALDGVNVEFERARFTAIRVWQVDADALHGRAGRP